MDESEKKAYEETLARLKASPVWSKRDEKELEEIARNAAMAAARFPKSDPSIPPAPPAAEPEAVLPPEETPAEEPPPTVSERYRIVVDRNLTYEQMVDAGHYDQEVGHARWGVDNLQPLRQAKEVVLVSFGRKMRLSKAEAGLAELGLEPAHLRDLLAFGAAHPDVQLCAKIVATGSCKEAKWDTVFFFCLYAEGEERVQGTIPYIDHSFPENLQFLAIVKDSVKEIS